ncbi:hypothetical protein OSB04_004353 [Centaurea solstitialis]|uniref:Conserved oligomeric Golgi complex subunit 2 n=1 Tax=Centaurea solstitialis TaxID=347529 RepID=A0AA38WPN8_9ASTR|nr:hypothetical protein OSB04_004353 [Centaurea solstitialis]
MLIQPEQPPLPSAPPRTATADLFGDPIDSHPLWFKQSSFLSPDFNSESYISDLRTFVPFETLRSELQSHLSSLKHELVELINRDYADFVNLSTKLVDVDAAVLRMRAPLVEIREKILGFRGAVEGSLLSLQGGLRQRAEASAAREILELLLDTSHVVSKVYDFRIVNDLNCLLILVHKVMLSKWPRETPASQIAGKLSIILISS